MKYYQFTFLWPYAVGFGQFYGLWRIKRIYNPTVLTIKIRVP